MKKIALDLDGVVFDSENLYRVYTEIYDVDHHHKDTVKDNSERIFQNRYNWQEEEFKTFYKENATTVLTTANIMTGAEVVLNKLKDKFEFIIVTARSDEETEIARKKLEEIGLENIKIYNNEHHKIERLLKEKVDYIIDDDNKICLNAASNNITGIYFKNAATKEIQNVKNIVNVNNWGEIYKYLILYN